MEKMSVKGACILCGCEQEVFLDKEGFNKYLSGISLQKALPQANSFEREFVLSGMCFQCQSKVFGHPSPGQEASYGKYLGSCDCCGYPLYARKLGNSSAKVCPQCHESVFEEVRNV